MPDFVVSALLRTLGRSIQSALDIVLVYGLKVLMARKGARPEVLSVVPAQLASIGDNPGFHGLNHEVDRVVVDTVNIPSISRHQVRCRRRRIDWAFRIHQKHDDTAVSIVASVAKTLERLVSPTATNQFPMQAINPKRALDLNQETIHALAQSGFGVPALSTPFHVDRDAQGLAPNSPIRHRSPSR